jgi:4-hydroxybenzoate polyprenyltransferase
MHTFILALRPHHWIKNGFVLAPMLFAFRYDDIESWTQALLAMASFCLMSSAVYLLNDIADREKDRLHPEKQHRAIASGKLAIPTAFGIILILALGSGALIMQLPPACLHILFAYAGMNLLYSLWLKHLAIMDVLTIAMGFILRLLMGGVAVDTPLSPWILATTFLLAMFLGFGKRYHELKTTGETTRASLNHYNANLLDRLISISCGATLMSYALYIVEMAESHGSLMPLASMLFVAYGLFRYLQLVYVSGKGGEPVSIIYKDAPFLLNLLLWLGVTLYSLQQ